MASSSRKALIIGINYIGTSNELGGCIGDAMNVKAMLLTKGYAERDITLMTDNTDIKPTRFAILSELMKLIASGCSKLYFHYSGHGASIRDTDGDEADSNDETIVPIDFNTSGMIIDDEVRGILISLTETQSLVAVLDCCHSGSGFDLKYNICEKVGSRQILLVEDKREKATRGNCIMLSGCADTQTSADTYEEGMAQGAMSYGFLKALSDPKVKTYEDLIVTVKLLLKQKGYTQVPCLSSGKYINLKGVISL